MEQDDTIRFACPNGHKLRVKPELAGKRIRCPRDGCGVIVTVPLPEVEATEELSQPGINYLFPPDQIQNLPSWRFVLHFMAPVDFRPAQLKRAIQQLKACEWKIVKFPDGLDNLFLSDESNAVGVGIEVPESRRRRPNALADYESDAWKIIGNMFESGFGDLYYEAVDWKE